MRSKFAIQGHPIHPMLVTVPIGLFVWALVADIIFLSTNEATWFEIARWTGVAAVITALLAALPGFGDYLGVGFTGKARQTATAHMLLNLTIVAAYIAAAVLMFGEFFGIAEGEISALSIYIATGLHAFGVVLLLVSGWLGGELVYRYRVGMITDAREDQMRAPEEVQRRERERAGLGR